jgi:hypothetical protein
MLFSPVLLIFCSILILKGIIAKTADLGMIDM